jgi:Coenzyme PQQ synthesis protein D (PqqD)
MQVERTDSNALVVNKLPDGSTVIVDAKNETVFALNATAGAAWDACSDPTTLSGVTERMQHSLDPDITEDLAQEAILRLQEQNLVKTSGSQPSRRQFIATLGAAVALPLVVSLPMTEQRAYAAQAASKVTSTPPPSTPPSNGGHGVLWWILHLLGLV